MKGRWQWRPWGALAGKGDRGEGERRDRAWKMEGGAGRARRASAGWEVARGRGCRELAAAAMAAGTLRLGGGGGGRRLGLARWAREGEAVVMAAVGRLGEQRSGRRSSHSELAAMAGRRSALGERRQRCARERAVERRVRREPGVRPGS